jgi:hypothetical protein
MSGFYGSGYGGDDGGFYTTIKTAQKGFKAYRAKHPASRMTFEQFKKSNYRKKKAGTRKRKAPAKSRAPAKKRGPNKGTADKRIRYNAFALTQAPVQTLRVIRALFNDAEKKARLANKAILASQKADKKLNDKKKKVGSAFY